MSIHALIKERRLALRMSEQALADAVGVTRGAVQQWEREDGTAPKRAIRKKVADALGLTVYDLAAAESQAPSFLGVAQSMSLHSYTMPPLLQWGEIKVGQLPELFRCEMPDDALRGSTSKGTVLLCSTSAQPVFGKGVVVADKAGVLYVRRYAQGRAGEWIAEADGAGFKSLHPEDGVKVVASVIGRFDGTV